MGRQKSLEHAKLCILMW